MTQEEMIHQSCILEQEIESLRRQLIKKASPEKVSVVNEMITAILKEESPSPERKEKIARLRSSIKPIRVDDTLYEKITNEIKEKQALSDELWEAAKNMHGGPKTRRKNYEDLANAILKRTVLDYESLISENISDNKENWIWGTAKYIEFTPKQKKYTDYDEAVVCNKLLIMDFAKNIAPIITKINFVDLLNQIKKDRSTKFIPYVSENLKAIHNEYCKFKKKKLTKADYHSQFIFRCPICGGALKPEYTGKMENIAHLHGIGCCGCEMFAQRKEISAHIQSKLNEKVRLNQHSNGDLYLSQKKNTEFLVEVSHVDKEAV